MFQNVYLLHSGKYQSSKPIQNLFLLRYISQHDCMKIILESRCTRCHWHPIGLFVGHGEHGLNANINMDMGSSSLSVCGTAET